MGVLVRRLREKWAVALYSNMVASYGAASALTSTLLTPETHLTHNELAQREFLLKNSCYRRIFTLKNCTKSSSGSSFSKITSPRTRHFISLLFPPFIPYGRESPRIEYSTEQAKTTQTEGSSKSINCYLSPPLPLGGKVVTHPPIPSSPSNLLIMYSQLIKDGKWQGRF